MKEIIASTNEAGQRLDKLLGKYLNRAPKSFLYKMLRKKNITLNGKKADGREQVAAGDVIKMFLADETVAKFSEHHTADLRSDLTVIYEDDDIILINKPAGMLSQKARPEDLSVVEHLIAYLLEEGSLQRSELAGFKPGICNRLDRNTSGIVIAGKSLAGLQQMNQLLKDRDIHKFYLCIVAGTLAAEQQIEGYLTKDRIRNQVIITATPSSADEKPICTRYRPVSHGRIGRQPCTLLEVELVTGRSHQIRAHLAAIGHGIIGDSKYGDAGLNQYCRKHWQLSHQLLHAFRLTLPELSGALTGVSGKTFLAPPPDLFDRIRKECELSYGDLEF